jgi:hypothetical protein
MPLPESATNERPSLVSDLGHHTQQDERRLERIRSTVAGELDGSVWYVGDERIEAADRDYWVDMQWLLSLLDEAERGN